MKSELNKDEFAPDVHILQFPDIGKTLTETRLIIQRHKILLVCASILVIVIWYVELWALFEIGGVRLPVDMHYLLDIILGVIMSAFIIYALYRLGTFVALIFLWLFALSQIPELVIPTPVDISQLIAVITLSIIASMAVLMVTQLRSLQIQSRRSEILLKEALTDSWKKGNELERTNAELEKLSEEREQNLEIIARAKDELETKVTERTLELKNAEEEMRALSHNLLEDQENERRLVAHELHSNVGQYLTVVKLGLDSARRGPPEKAPAILNELTGQVSEVIKQVRDMSFELRPGMLDDLGLVPSLIWLIGLEEARSGLKISFEHAELDMTLSNGVITAAYRIIQSALNNITERGGATRINIRLWVKNNALAFTIQDNDKISEVNKSAFNKSPAINSMRERAKAVVGTLVWETSQDGIKITAELPI